MKKVVLLLPVLLAFFTALTVPYLANAGDVPPEDLKKAAMQGLISRFKKHIFNNNLKHKGFSSQSDLESAELGEGFRIYNIKIDKFQNYSTNHDIQSLTSVSHQNEWLFPVVSGGKARTLLKLFMGIKNGKWHAVDIDDSSLLAKELEGIMAAWPSSAGYSFRYIRALGATSEFLELSKGGKVVGIIPLSALMAKSGRTTGEYKPDDVTDPQEYLKELRLRFEQNNDLSSTPAVEVMAAAREGLISRVKKRKIEERRFLGFESQDDIDNAELGEGFKVFGMDTNKILGESVPPDFQSVSVGSGGWHFPIVANGKTVTQIGCRLANGIWRCRDLGPAGLGKAVAELRTIFPASSGYQFRIVSTIVGAKTYIEISQGGKVLGAFPMIALFNAKVKTADAFKREVLRNPQEFLKELQIDLKNRIDWHKQNPGITTYDL